MFPDIIHCDASEAVPRICSQFLQEQQMRMVVRRKLVSFCVTAARQFSQNPGAAGTAVDEWKARDFGSFRRKDLIIKKATDLKEKPKDWDHLLFGHNFSDHMLEVKWSEDGGWEKPQIVPIHDLSLHPAAKVFHYAIQLFEGMKAYRGVDNKIRIFRPDMNMSRMVNTAARSCLPTFDEHELLECINELVKLDQEWVPYSTSSSLYIRPTFIGTEPHVGIRWTEEALLYVIVGPVGSYYHSDKMKALTLMADPSFVRAAPGGTGSYKMGCNYAPTILIGKIAQDHGCQQVLWLYGDDEQLTEVGTMNIFVYLKNEQGENELVTPGLDSGLILPGVTRQSLIDLAREWGEFKVSERTITMAEIKKALNENRLMEMFGAGTACIVCPVDNILYKTSTGEEKIFIPTMQSQYADTGKPLMQKFFDSITDIQYGRKAKSSWTRLVN